MRNFARFRRGKAKTKTFADLQTGIEIAAVEDCAKTMRILGENLIVLGEQTVAAQKQAEKDYKKTVAAQKQAEKDYEKTAKQLATALAQLQEAKKKVGPTPTEKLQDTVDAWNDAMKEERFGELGDLAVSAKQCALSAGFEEKDFNLQRFAADRLAAQEAAAAQQAAA